jgi:hypothetical protein
MEKTNKLLMLGLILAVGGILFAVGFVLSKRAEQGPDSWTPKAEGFLAVPTPCCSEASLWDSLDEQSEDGQRPRPASAEEAAVWLNQWPYRRRDGGGAAVPTEEESLQVAAQSNEVRCVGAATGPDIPAHLPDEQILGAIRSRRECTYAKWKVWSGETAEQRPNERHTVWVDDAGFYHGRVDYWK